MPVCVMCRWRSVSAVFFIWVLFRGVFQRGLIRTVFICLDFLLFRGMTCAGEEGKRHEFVERQGFFLLYIIY